MGWVGGCSQAVVHSSRERLNCHQTNCSPHPSLKTPFVFSLRDRGDLDGASLSLNTPPHSLGCAKGSCVVPRSSHYSLPPRRGIGRSPRVAPQCLGPGAHSKITLRSARVLDSGDTDCSSHPKGPGCSRTIPNFTCGAAPASGGYRLGGSRRGFGSARCAAISRSRQRCSRSRRRDSASARSQCHCGQHQRA